MCVSKSRLFPIKESRTGLRVRTTTSPEPRPVVKKKYCVNL